MTPRQVVLCGTLLAAFTVLSILLLDGRIAVALQPHATAVRTAVSPFVSIIETLFLFNVSKFATGAILVVAALLMMSFARRRHTGRLLLIVGLAHLTSRLISGVLKNVFLRARPFEALATSPWHDRFFTDGGSSFPSGHATHFWALFFALALTFPKARVPAFTLAVLLSIARIATNDHYLGDVTAAAAISALVSAAFATLLQRATMRR